MCKIIVRLRLSTTFENFRGNAYEEHTKCVTEEQRYAAKGFVAKEKKGEQKQNAWVEMVQEVLDEQKNAPANVLRILNTVSKHNNTPRKKPKFINFVKNVCGHKTNPKDIDSAWDMISVKLAALALNRNQNGNTTSSEIEKKNESKIEDEEEVTSTTDPIQTNGTTEETENGGVEEGDNGEAQTEGKVKKSKKQRKEEKKRQKYEAELQKAAQVPTEEVEEEPKSKKDKKKSKAATNGEINGDDTESNKNKKRKRQDTVNEVVATEVSENTSDMPQIQNLQVTTEKTKKKKPKIDQEEEDESLHNQNVAQNECSSTKAEKFNWHAVIMSVLEKKGNEVPFKRLQKKVLGEYSEVTGMEVDDRIADKFIKKLKSAPNVRVDKNRVILVQ